MITVKIQNKLPENVRTELAVFCRAGEVKLVFAPELGDDSQLTEEDLIGVVTDISSVDEAEIELQLEIHHPHRFVELSNFELRQIGNDLYVVQIEIFENYVPGYAPHPPTQEEDEVPLQDPEVPLDDPEQ